MARRSAAGTDITCVVFDASQMPQDEDIGWMRRVANEKPERVVFVLNKADKSPFFEDEFRAGWKEAIEVSGSSELELEKGKISLSNSNSELELSKRVDPVWIKCIATTEGGARPVLDALFSLAEDGEPLFDDDIVTDYPRKLAIADAIREKYLAELHQELPHEMGVLVKSVSDEGSRWRVDAEILVNRPSQKPIVIGRGAETIKKVRKGAERELTAMFGVKIKLELWVRVEQGWMKNERLLAEMGYLGELV